MVDGETRKITEESDPGDLISSARAREIVGLELTSSFVRVAKAVGLRCWHRSWSSRLFWSEADVRAAFHMEQDSKRSQDSQRI